MTTAIVTVLDDERLIREGEAAVDLYVHDLKNVRARIMPMARGLCAAKRKYPATQDFGDWLQTSPYSGIEKDDRAALIKIGERDDFASKFVRTTSLVSPRTIWEAIEELMPTSHDANSDPVPDQPADSQQSAPQERAKAESADAETPISTPTSPVSTHRSPFLALKLPKDEIELVHQHMLNVETRSALAKLVGKKATRPIWGLVIESIRSGTFGPPSKANITVGNLRLLFPWLNGRTSFGQQDLTKPYTQQFVRTYVFPLLCEDSSLMNPDGAEINRLSMLRRAEAENQERERLRLEQHETAVKKLPANEQAVIAYSKPLWPQIGDIRLPYDYNELCHAVWYWTFFLGIARREWSPKDTGMAVRHLTKYIGPLQPGFVQAVREISSAYEQRPDGESKFPMTPVNFGL